MKKGIFIKLNIFRKLVNDKTLDRLIEIVAVLAVFLLAFVVNKSNYVSYQDLASSDIFYEYSSAVNISNGINPYTKILRGSLLSNNKYATLFPIYYYYLLGIAAISKYSFTQFIDIYRYILFGAECLAFIFTYLKFRKINKYMLGFAAASFLILNRWVINNVADMKQDTVAIALLMASLYFIDSKRRLSYLLYGLSLSIKHLGILIFPLYLLPIVNKEWKWKQSCLNLALVAVPLLLPSIPFIVDNYKAFILSLMFSLTRAPTSAGTTALYGYEKLLVLYGSGKNFSLLLALLPRLPLLGFSLLNILLLFTKKIPRYIYALFSIVLFITFNPVYFDQYFFWSAPFILYSLTDYFSEKHIRKISPDEAK